MLVLPAGEYEMGSPAGKGGDVEKPQHRVRVGRFALGKTEVTQGQWRAVTGGNPSYFAKCGDDCPVEQVSWEDAKLFIRKLNERVSGNAEGPYRLPSESEWEYGCRGGVSGEEYCGGNDWESVAWYASNSGSKTQRVGTKSANRWGLHDMSGNVSEWVEDCWNGSYRGAPTRGEAWTSGDCSRRVVRGGSWYSWYFNPALVRSAIRYGDGTSIRYGYLGFRVARTLP